MVILCIILNSFFIDEVLDLLKKFQESNVQRELEVFNCMIKNLFEEYKYFPQYPEKELHITAQLFGGIIEHGLVNLIPLGLALRYVNLIIPLRSHAIPIKHL